MTDIPIGTQIKNFREDKGMNRKAFAEKYKLNLSNLYKWERGTKPSDPEDYRKLEDILKNVSREKFEAAESEHPYNSISRLLTMLEKEQENVKNAHEIIRMLAERSPDTTEAVKNVLVSQNAEKLKPVK